MKHLFGPLLLFGLFVGSFVASWPGVAGHSRGSSRGLIAKSKSGRYRLDVVRTNADQARYRVRRDGETVWTGEKPFYLRGAVVSEKGVVAGFAHTNTVTGPEVFGSLEIIVLDANGDLRSRWTTPREYSRFPDGPENPTGRAVTLARDPERIIVRVSENDLENPRERLWIYQLDGKGEVVKLRFASAFLKSDGTGDLVAAHGVKGTPLLLCHWETDWYLAYHGVPIGSRFQLYHPSGALVWSLNVAGPAYSFTDDVTLWDRDRNKRMAAEVLPGKVVGQFVIRLVVKRQEVTYKARRANDGWAVTEVSRRPYTPRPN